MNIIDILLIITGGAAIGFYAGLEYMRSKILDGSLRSLIVDKIDRYYIGVYDLELSIKEIEKEINNRIETSRRKKKGDALTDAAKTKRL